jgi:xylan 1,4-beta-xylosidase
MKEDIIKLKRKVSIFLFLTISLSIVNGYAQTASNIDNVVSIQVDLNIEKGPLKPMWAFFGHDEPNYTYMKDGQKLLTELAELSPVPVFMRVHNLLNTGDGTPGFKWGSTNVYTEDENGNPVYSWTIMDRIFDTWIERGIKPLAQIAFMPEALNTGLEPYYQVRYLDPKLQEKAGNDGFRGPRYPPNDYDKWAALVYEWVKHSIERYGKEEVESWLWELWNEPQGSNFKGTTEEFLKMWDYTADAVKRALPTAKIGGPHTGGGSTLAPAEFFRAFLDHVVYGKNYVTGQTGSPLDFIAFHAKGRPAMVDGVVQMNMGRQLNHIDKGFQIISSYPTLRHLPIIIGECDPEGCAACPIEFYPQNEYRNGTLFSSYTAASFARIYDLEEAWGVNLRGAVTWAFEFEDQPYFAGFRTLSTNGIDKPVLNVFRMFGMMQGERVGVRTDSPYNYLTIRDSSVRGEVPDINALAAKDDKSVAVMVWNYHDDNIIRTASPVKVKLKGFPVEQVKLSHYRIDQEFSNSYEVWKKMGSPPNPSSKQYAELEKAGQLEMIADPDIITTKDGEAVIDFQLPGQGVSLLRFSW